MARLKILHLDDQPAETDVVAATLRREGFEVEVTPCAEREDFIKALEQQDFDVILLDHRLPSFDGPTALRVARQLRPEIPVIFVSGFLGEEAAIELLKGGATDYVFKHNLARLGPALTRAMQQSADHRARVEAERALRESEATLRSFIDASPVLMGMVEALPDDLQLVSFNPAVEQFFGTQDLATPVRASELGLSLESIRAWLAAMTETTKSGEPIQFEDALDLGGGARHLSVSMALVPPASPSPSTSPRFCFVAQDLTERRQLEQQMMRSQRLESIGTLASGIAHDLNNVLAPVTLALKFFRPRFSAPDDLELLNCLESSVQRGSQIIRQLLGFARGADGERKPIAWSKLMSDLEQMIVDTFPRSIELRMSLARDPGPVVGDTTQIYQILINLCLNARDAMPLGGVLTVSVANVSLAPEQARLLATGTGPQAVCIRVIDTGSGIPESIQSRIFDPFFTTKEIGHGTGLGLSTVLSIVKNHGGFVSLESTEGRGSEFRIYFPIQEGTQPAALAEAAIAAPRGEGQLILVVDDERSIRTVAQAALVDQGYQVLSAANGQQALELFQREADRVQLIVTDLLMPHMDGATLIDRIRQLAPDMRFVAMSGLLEHSSHGQAGVRLLQKPFTAEELLGVIHEALAEEAPKPAATGRPESRH